MIVSIHEKYCVGIYWEWNVIKANTLHASFILFSLLSFFCSWEKKTFWFCKRNQNNKCRIERVLIYIVYMRYLLTVTASVRNGLFAIHLKSASHTYRIVIPCYEPRENWIVPLFFFFILIVFFLRWWDAERARF